MSLVIQKSSKKFAPRASKRKRDEITGSPVPSPLRHDATEQAPLDTASIIRSPPPSPSAQEQPEAAIQADSTPYPVLRHGSSQIPTILASNRSSRAWEQGERGPATVPTPNPSGLVQGSRNDSDSVPSREVASRGPKFRRRNAATGQVEDIQEEHPRSRGQNRPAPTLLRRRGSSPEDSEQIEIITATCTMGDLVKDGRWGKKSNRYNDIKAIDWKAMRKQNRDREEEIARRKETGRGAESRLDRLAAVADVTKPGTDGIQMKIVDGQIVVDQDSLQIDRHAAAQEIEEILEEVEENDLTTIVNSATYGKRTARNRWSREQTDLLYAGLRSFGTDFEIISRMIPGMTRRHVKLKFDKEERINLGRVNEALLGPRTPISLGEFADKVGVKVEELADPQVVQAELDEVVSRFKLEAEAEKEAERVELERRRAAAEASHAAVRSAASEATGSAGNEGHAAASSGTAAAQPGGTSRKPPEKGRAGRGKGTKKNRTDVVEDLGTIDEMPPVPLERVRRR